MKENRLKCECTLKQMMMNEVTINLNIQIYKWKIHSCTIAIYNSNISPQIHYGLRETILSLEGKARKFPGGKGLVKMLIDHERKQTEV